MEYDENNIYPGDVVRYLEAAKATHYSPTKRLGIVEKVVGDTVTINPYDGAGFVLTGVKLRRYRWAIEKLPLEELI